MRVSRTMALSSFALLLALGSAAPHLYDLTTDTDDLERAAVAAAQADGGHRQPQDRWTVDCRQQGGDSRHLCVVVERQVDRYYLDVREGFCIERRVEVVNMLAVSVSRGPTRGCGYPPGTKLFREQ